MKKLLLLSLLTCIGCNSEQYREEPVKTNDSLHHPNKNITVLPNMDSTLISDLEEIYNSDQGIRYEFIEIEKKHSRDSKEFKEFEKRWMQTDSLNLIKIRNILDQHGWHGSKEVGDKGNSAFFLVIQHADQTTQEKYLPVMRDAVKNGKASAQNLALLEDRVLLGQGKKQIYGSQIGMDQVTKAYYVDALEDPDNVDKRRAEVGLEPMADYVKNWDLKWNIKSFKKFWADKEAKGKTKK